MPNLNVRILEFINGAAGYYHPLDRFFVDVTSNVTLAIVAVVVGFYIGIYLPFKQKGTERVHAIKNSFYIAGAVAASFLVTYVIKLLVAFPRPFQTITTLHTLIALPSDYSFPSGHATVTMAFATAVYVHHKKLGMLLFAFAFAVGVARVYVGVHYPIDVGVGFLIGFFIPKLIAHFFIKKESLTLQ